MGEQVLPGCFAGTWAARVVQRARPGRYHISLLSFIPSILPLSFGDCHSGASSPSFHIQLPRDRAVSCQAVSLTELPRKAGLGGWCSFLTAGKLRLRTWSNLPGALSAKKLLLGAEAADSKSTPAPPLLPWPLSTTTRLSLSFLFSHFLSFQSPHTHAC